MLASRTGRTLRGVAILSLALASLSACDSGSTDPTPTPLATAARTFDFELLQWRCNHADVRTATVVVKAEGEFCFAALNVKNVGDAPASLDASCQFMVDGDSTYPPQPEAMALDDTALAGFGGEIGPGEVVQDSALYYDVPKGTHPDALELHEDCSDPGLRLPLDAALRSDRL